MKIAFCRGRVAAVGWLWSWLVLAALSLGAAPALPGVGDGKVFLDLHFTIRGEGSVPDTANTTGAEQTWKLLRTFNGWLEVEAKVEPTAEPRVVYRPKVGGLNGVIGRKADHCDERYEQFGAGSSSMIWKGTEDWGTTVPMQGKGLETELTFAFLEDGSGVWNGTIGLGGWLQALNEGKEYYVGFGSYLHGRDGGWTDPWTHVAAAREDRYRAGHGISGGFHPVDSPVVTFPVPTRPAVLTNGYYSGRVDAPIPKPAGYPGTWKMIAELSWTLRDKLPDVELKVRSGRYTAWGPTMQVNAVQPGESLEFVATVESPSGDGLERIAVKKFVWTLQDTSREPGVALNLDFPPGEAHPDADLRIRGIPTKDEEGQEAEEIPAEGWLASRVEIEPWDWGGWTTLKVRAELVDGRTLDGELDSEASPGGGPLTEIPVPHRRGGEKTALRWKQDNGVEGASDLDDKETVPEGKPDADGDGLTVYEEYRGIYVQGFHRTLDPRKKDLVILNDSRRPVTRNAVNIFESRSQLVIHRVAPAELDAFGRSSLVVNRYRREGPTRGSQHGLWLADTELLVRPNEVPSGTRPRDRRRILVPGALRQLPGVASTGDGLNYMLVQALFQSVGVSLAGPMDRTRQFDLSLADPKEGGVPRIFVDLTNQVVVLDAQGRDFARTWNDQLYATWQAAKRPGWKGPPPQTFETFHWLMGKKHGSHSGPENSLMRDWFADGYESRDKGPDNMTIYRLLDRSTVRENPGTVLGTTLEGSTFNAGNASPEPRYDSSVAPAPANRQLIVNDNLP